MTDSLDIQRSPESFAVSGARLKIAFELRGDRWGHGVFLKSTGKWLPIISSIEGTPDNTFPPSPAFQDLRLESIDEMTAEFQLMGQSGTCVYSAAIRFEGRSGLIDFDLCTRFRKVTEETRAGSSYRLDVSVGQFQLRTPNESRAIVEVSQPDDAHSLSRSVGDECPALLGLESVAIGDHPAAMWKLHRNDQGSADKIDCQPPGNSSPAVSLRWRYQISLIQTNTR